MVDKKKKADVDSEESNDQLNGEADQDLSLVRKLIDAGGIVKNVSQIKKMNFISLTWGIAFSQMGKMYDRMYENVHSFNFEPFMDMIDADYQASRTGVFGDAGAVAEMQTNFNWEKFRAWDDTICEKYVNPSNPKYKPEFVKIFTSKDRIRLYFSIRDREKALLRLALGGATKDEMDQATLMYDAFLLFAPSP